MGASDESKKGDAPKMALSDKAAANAKAGPTGSNALQVRTAMARPVPCQIGAQSHVCVMIDTKQRIGKAPNGMDLALVNGL